MKRRAKRESPRWAESHIWTADDGTVVHSQREYIGYGFTSYMIVGSREGIAAQYERIQKNYHPSWYCGSYPDPEELGDGLWIGQPSHSESCE